MNLKMTTFTANLAITFIWRVSEMNLENFK